MGGYVAIGGRAGFPGQNDIPPSAADIQMLYWTTGWAFGSNPTDDDWHLVHLHYVANHVGGFNTPNIGGAVNASDVGFENAGVGARDQIVPPTSPSGASSLNHSKNVGTRGWCQSYAVPSGPYTLRLVLPDTHGGAQQARTHVLARSEAARVGG